MDNRVLLLAIVGVVVLRGADAGCRDARGYSPENPMCCQGRNNTCKALGPRNNDPESKHCFCDSACLILDDCCQDFKDHCPAQDCELDDKFGPYGECDTRCGWGAKSRTKRIFKEPKNGGKACPPREQKIACYGLNCKVPRAPGGFEELRETGRIIPAEFGSWRKNKLYNPYKDIRKNLFENYHNNMVERPAAVVGRDAPNPYRLSTYCAKFEIVEARKPCAYSPFGWAGQLSEGATVCVECQQLAMKKRLGVRCHGHGVYLKETRFNAVTVPGCHGKWVMKSRHEDCNCQDEGQKNELSFILI